MYCLVGGDSPPFGAKPYLAIFEDTVLAEDGLDWDQFCLPDCRLVCRNSELKGANT